MATAVFWCVKCKVKKSATVSNIVHKPKVDMLVGKCPKCSTKMCRFAAKK